GTAGLAPARGVNADGSRGVRRGRGEGAARAKTDHKPTPPHARLSLAPPDRAIHVREARGRRRVPERQVGSARKQCRGSTPAPPRDPIMQYGEFGFLNFGLVLLAAAVLSVPIARRLGLSAIAAYPTPGIIIGPHRLAPCRTP